MTSKKCLAQCLVYVEKVKKYQLSMKRCFFIEPWIYLLALIKEINKSIYKYSFSSIFTFLFSNLTEVA